MARHTTFRFTAEVDHSLDQLLCRHLGARRFAYNQCLAMVKAALDAQHRGKPAAVPWTGFDLINAFNEWKRSEQAGRRFSVDSSGRAELVDKGLAWRSEVCAQVFEEAAVDLGRALGAFSRGRRQKRHAVGFPRFHKRAGSCRSFRLRNKSGRAAIRVGEHGARSITLPVIGTVRVREDTRRLRRLVRGDSGARILFVTVSQRRGRWVLSVTVEAPELHEGMRHHGANGPFVGVDLGISAFVVTARADGVQLERITYPRSLRSALPRLRTAGRGDSRTVPGSQGRALARRRLAFLHARIASQRQHFLHETSSKLVKTHDRLCVEDSAIANMLANHRLARSLANASLASFLNQLSYKANWYSSELVVAPRFFASSKTCSRCGAKKQHLSLSERMFCCECCGYRIDRDANAAANLAAFGDAESSDRRQRPRTPKCEAGSSMPVEDGALAITSRDGETLSVNPTL